jgi:hypothetical protein
MQSTTQKAQASLRGGSGGWHIEGYYAVSDTGKWTPMTTVKQAGRNGFSQPRLLRSNFAPMQGDGIPNVPTVIPPALHAPSVPYPGNLGNFRPSDIPYPFPDLPMIPVNGMEMSPCLGCGGLGIRLYQETKGVKVSVSVVLHMQRPEVLFDAEIDNGNIKADLHLVGAGGVTVKLDAGSKPEFQGNINEIGMIPIDITVPIGLIVPLSIDLSQSIVLQSAFSAKTSTLHGEAGIDIKGEIFAEYDDGWKITAPQPVVKQSLASLVSGISVGINSMVFAVNQRLLVGVGAFGFATGPYVNLISSMTSLKGSSVSVTLLSRTPVCAQGTFEMTLGAGIGYSMPRVVAAVINTILGWFGAKPIKSTGSIIALPKNKTLIQHRDENPEGCAGS